MNLRGILIPVDRLVEVPNGIIGLVTHCADGTEGAVREGDGGLGGHGIAVERTSRRVGNGAVDEGCLTRTARGLKAHRKLNRVSELSLKEEWKQGGRE